MPKIVDITQKKCRNESNTRLLLAISEVVKKYGMKNPKSVTDSIGVARCFISQLPSKARPASDSVLNSLHSLYGVRKDYILYGTGNVFSSFNTCDVDVIVEENRKLKEELIELQRKYIKLLSNE